MFLLNPILTVLTLYLLAPYTHQRIKQYQHNNSKFGDSFFNFNATAGNFYGVYLKTFGMIAGLGVLAAIAIPAKLTVLFVLLPIAFLLVMVYFAVQLPNLIWNSTGLGEHTFFSHQRVRPFLWISFTNLLFIALTLGLFIPFAEMRMMRYKLENMGLNAQGDLSEFVAGQTQTTGAMGEETSAMFDVDISL